MSWNDWLLWGFVGTLLLTIIEAASQGLGFSRMSLPFILGTMFTADRDRAKIIGFAVHLLNGWIFALPYVLVFHSLRRANWWLGASVGLVQALSVLTIGVAVLPAVHPRMATEQHGPEVAPELEPPGFLALNYGVQTPLSVIIAHLVFGAVLGAFYRLPHSLLTR